MSARDNYWDSLFIIAKEFHKGFVVFRFAPWLIY